MRTVLPVIAVLVLSTAALADPPANTIMKVSPPNAPAMDPAKICAMQLEQSVATLGLLEKALTLTDKQKPLFDTWRTTRIETMRGWPCPRPSTGVEVPTPTRLDREEKLLSYELDALRKEKPLIAALFDALSPEQRAIFDNPAAAVRPAPGQAGPAPAH